MKHILCLLLAGCASAPEQLVSVNDHVNQTRPYRHYFKTDNRFLNVGEAGNCSARAYTKVQILRAQGITAYTERCARPIEYDGCHFVGQGRICPNAGNKGVEPHIYAVAEIGGKWVLDKDVRPYKERNCVK